MFEDLKSLPDNHHLDAAVESDKAVTETEKIVEQEHSVLFPCIVVFSVTFVGFCYGFDTGTISGFTNMPNYIEYFGQLNHTTGEYYLSTTRTSLIVAFFSIGACIGSIFLSPLANYRGRKYSLLAFLILYMVAYIIQISSTKGKWYQMFVGRIIAGAACGSMTNIAPMFAGELSPAKIRGGLVCSFQLFVTLAIFLGYCFNYATFHHNSSTDTSQWRIVMGLNFLWALIIFVCVSVIVPESPRFLIEIGKFDQAKKNIAYINRLPIDSDFVNNEFKLVEEALLTEKAAGNANWKELITGKPKIFRRVFMGFMIMALQQLTGVNYFFYYGTSIFKSVGLKDSFETPMILGVINFVFTIVSVFLVDKMGRRNVLLLGAIVGDIALYIYSILGTVALYPNGRDEPSSIPVGNAMIFLTCLFLAAFAMSWGSVGWVILAETFPIRIRSKASSIGVLSSFLWSFLISFFTPYITNKIHMAFGFIFAGCLTFAVFYVYFFVYETKGLTLEDVDIMYSDPKVTPWTSSKWCASHTASTGANIISELNDISSVNNSDKVNQA